jgi:hypothetical protein
MVCGDHVVQNLTGCGKKSPCRHVGASAAKAVDFAGLTARLKPRPFKTRSKPEVFRSLTVRTAKTRSRPEVFRNLTVRTAARNIVRIYAQTIITLMLLGVLLGCSEPAQTPTAKTPQPTGLESIPAPDPSKYPPFSNMGGWKNPYFVVREDGIGFVDLSNREIHVLKPEEIPAELVSLPPSAWPYGRVVLVTQAVPKNPTNETKADLRKNRALLLGTLQQLDVQVREAP